VLGFELMTYGSESECATHYTTAPHKCVKVIALRELARSNNDDIYIFSLVRKKGN